MCYSMEACSQASLIVPWVGFAKPNNAGLNHKIKDCHDFRNLCRTCNVVHHTRSKHERLSCCSSDSRSLYCDLISFSALTISGHTSH